MLKKRHVLELVVDPFIFLSTAIAAIQAMTETIARVHKIARVLTATAPPNQLAGIGMKTISKVYNCV